MLNTEETHAVLSEQGRECSREPISRDLRRAWLSVSLLANVLSGLSLDLSLSPGACLGGRLAEACMRCLSREGRVGGSESVRGCPCAVGTVGSGPVLSWTLHWAYVSGMG